jgi:arylsulfatase A-like enzyme
VRPVTHPNVLIYLADALRADYLGVYGHRDATSPQVDAFARDAIVFESVMAQSSWTLPTVASLFTGLGAPAHGVVETGSVLSQAIDTLAERFRATGYRTAAFLGNDVVGARFGFNQGFDVWRPCGRMRPLPLVQEALQNGVFSGPSPFFVYIHSLEPHAPFEPGPEFWAPFAFDYRGTRDTRTLRSRSVTAEEGRYERTAYEGEIRETDAAFGVLLRALSDQGVLDRSVVVFTADHGEGLRERGGRGGHGHNLYREVCRIPLVIRLPGGRGAGKRWSEPVQQVDLLPSLLGLAGLAAEGPGEGRDLSRQWEAGVPAREDRLLFSSLSRSGFKKSAVQLGKTKLIVNKDALWEQARRLELYDVEGDPGERHNLAAERPVLTRYLQRLMWQEEGRQRELGQRLQSGERLALSPDELRQLRALGYVE